MTVLAVEGWGEAVVVVVKKAGRGGWRASSLCKGRVMYYFKSLLN